MTRTKPAAPPQPQGPSAGKKLLRAIFQPKRLLLLAIVASVPFWQPLVGRFLPDLSDQPEFLVSGSEIEVNALPHWVPADLVAQVLEVAKLPPQLSLLSPELTEQLAHAFAQHPWVARVVEVRKQSSPPRLQVTLEFREPVCMVEMRDGLYPLSADGTLLPSRDFSLAETAHYIKIQNVRSTPSGPEGTPWGDPTVAGACRLAESLRDHWADLQLKAIRAPKRTTAEVDLDELEYSLVTDGGSSILWGRAPGVDRPGELTVTQKIGRLEKYLADFGSFDRPAGPYEIDIRHWQQISRRRLAEDRNAVDPAKVRR